MAKCKFVDRFTDKDQVYYFAKMIKKEGLPTPKGMKKVKSVKVKKYKRQKVWGLYVCEK